MYTCIVYEHFKLKTFCTLLAPEWPDHAVSFLHQIMPGALTSFLILISAECLRYPRRYFKCICIPYFSLEFPKNRPIAGQKFIKYWIKQTILNFFKCCLIKSYTEILIEDLEIKLRDKCIALRAKSFKFGIKLIFILPHVLL